MLWQFSCPLTVRVRIFCTGENPAVSCVSSFLERLRNTPQSRPVSPPYNVPLWGAWEACQGHGVQGNQAPPTQRGTEINEGGSRDPVVLRFDRGLRDPVRGQ